MVAPAGDAEQAVGDALYRLTVQQRDAAWRECERLRVALAEAASVAEFCEWCVASGHDDSNAYIVGSRETARHIKQRIHEIIDNVRSGAPA